MTTTTSPFGQEHRLAPSVFESALMPIADTERLDRRERASAALTGLGLAFAAFVLCSILGLLIVSASFHTALGDL